jgi:hypothetical protein
MADPSVQSKDGVGGGHRGSPTNRHRRSKERSRIFRELVHVAAEQGASIHLGISTADALQECLDRAVALLRFASNQIDNLLIDAPDDLANLGYEEDPLFEVITNPQGPDTLLPHRYLKMEEEARREVEKLAAMMTQLGIAERVVRVEEAKAALIVAAIRESALEAGISHDQVRLLGAALRRRLPDARTHTGNGTYEERRESRKLLHDAAKTEKTFDDVPSQRNPSS